ncbi:hypothetical protein EME01_19660 [Sinorhizobium meliloti]|nr:hypothetical protein EME01_19660 [Sinorhizobium meliloti]
MIQRDSGYDRIEQRPVRHGLGEEIHRAILHRLNRHRDIAATGQENDGLANAALGQMVLEIEPAFSWHVDVKNQAARAIQYVNGVEQFLRRGEADGLEARREDQLGQTLAHGCVVIDDDDNWFG